MSSKRCDDFFDNTLVLWEKSGGTNWFFILRRNEWSRRRAKRATPAPALHQTRKMARPRARPRLERVSHWFWWYHCHPSNFIAHFPKSWFGFFQKKNSIRGVFLIETYYRDLSVDWLIDYFDFGCSVDWLCGWLTDWLNDWLVDWLIGWLIDWLQAPSASRKVAAPPRPLDRRKSQRTISHPEVMRRGMGNFYAFFSPWKRLTSACSCAVENWMWKDWCDSTWRGSPSRPRSCCGNWRSAGSAPRISTIWWEKSLNAWIRRRRRMLENWCCIWRLDRTGSRSFGHVSSECSFMRYFRAPTVIQSFFDGFLLLIMTIFFDWTWLVRSQILHTIGSVTLSVDWLIACFRQTAINQSTHWSFVNV